jgi:hypothetical protein
MVKNQFTISLENFNLLAKCKNEMLHSTYIKSIVKLYLYIINL